jgi:hypothetical protein
MTVLPFGGRHADALANLSGMVPPRLKNNKKLHNHLARNASRIWTKTESGLRVRTIAWPIEPGKIIQLFTYIVRGLLFHHWNVRVSDNHFIDVMLLARGGQSMFNGFMQMNAKAREHRNLGSSTFTYDGIQGLDNDAVSMWRFSIYGDITFAGDPQSLDEEAVQIGAITGPKHISDKVALRERLTAPMSLAVW